MKLSAIFTVLNQLKIDHWQTKSYAEHKALATAYEVLDELFDKFVELLYGRDGIPTDQIAYTVKSDSYGGNLSKQYREMKIAVIQYLRTVASNDGDLKNVVDEIEGEFNHLLYRLQQT